MLACQNQYQQSQRSQLSRILRESHAFHLQLTLSRARSSLLLTQSGSLLLLL